MSFREKEKLIDLLATYLSDASQDVRNNAKQAFSTLSNLLPKSDFETLMNKSLSESKYNKVKEFLEKGFQASMSDFSPSKQSFYRGTNKSTRKKFRASGATYASDGFEAQGGYKGSPLKYKTASKISDNRSTNGDAMNAADKIYSQRTPLSSKNLKTEYEAYPRYGDSGSSLSSAYRLQNHRIQKIVPSRGGESVSGTDIEDSKQSGYSPSKSSKQQKRIPKRNIRKLDEKSVPRAPDFSRREVSEYTPSAEERDIFARLKDPDSKVASKAAEQILNNYEEYEAEIPNNLSTIIGSQAALF